MADIFSPFKPEGIENYTSRSQGAKAAGPIETVATTPVDRGPAALIEGIGNTFMSAVKGFDNLIKEDIETQILDAEETINAQHGLDPYNKSADFLNSSKDYPAEIDREVAALTRLKKAKESGSFDEKSYYTNLLAVSRRLRNQYGSYRDVIDQKMQAITGVDPANAILRMIDGEQKAAQRAAQAKLDANQKFALQNLEYLHGKVKDPLNAPIEVTAPIVAAQQRRDYEVKVARDRYELDAAAGKAQERQGDALLAATVAKEETDRGIRLGGAVDPSNPQAGMSQLITIMNTPYNELTPDMQDKATQMVAMLEAQNIERKRQYSTHFSGKASREAINGQFKQWDDEIAVVKGWTTGTASVAGRLYEAKRVTETRSDLDFLGNDTARYLATEKRMLSPEQIQARQTLMTANSKLLSQQTGRPESDFNLELTLVNNIVDGLVMGKKQSVTEQVKAAEARLGNGRKLSPSSVSTIIDSNVSLFSTGRDVTPATIEAAEALYGVNNSRFMEMVPKTQQAAMWNKMFGPDARAKIESMKATYPQLFANFIQMATTSFDHTFTKSAKSAVSVKEGSYTTDVTFDPVKFQFVTVPRVEPELGVGVGGRPASETYSVIGGIRKGIARVNTDWAIGEMQTVNSALTNLKATLDMASPEAASNFMKLYFKTTGIDPYAPTTKWKTNSELLSQFGRAIGGAFGIDENFIEGFQGREPASITGGTGSDEVGGGEGNDRLAPGSELSPEARAALDRLVDAGVVKANTTREKGIRTELNELQSMFDSKLLETMITVQENKDGTKSDVIESNMELLSEMRKQIKDLELLRSQSGF